MLENLRGALSIRSTGWTPPHFTEYDNAELLLKQIGEIFDISDIIEPQDEPKIMDYYAKNRLLYRLACSWDGFQHSAISYDGTYKRDDVREPPRSVEH